MWLRNNLLERTCDLTKQRILRGSIQNTPENGDFTVLCLFSVWEEFTL